MTNKTTSSPPRPHLVPGSGDDLKSDLVPSSLPLRGDEVTGVRTTTTTNTPSSSPKRDEVKPRGLDLICQVGTNPFASAPLFRRALREEIEDAIREALQ